MRARYCLLALIAPLAMALWTTDAQAIPAFARQLGVACDTCHYQRFPVLNAFGRSFKDSGFTMVGAEGTIESPTGMLSIPTNLNAAIELYSGYTKANGPTGAAANETNTTKSTNSGNWQIPSSSSVFFGGRVSEHIGFEAELAITKSIMEMHGGTVTVESGNGRTRFTVRFPRGSSAINDLAKVNGSQGTFPISPSIAGAASR